MTTLYRLAAPAAEAARALGAAAGGDPWSGGTVSPGGFAPVVTAGREFVAGPRPQGRAPRRMIPRQWGVPPPRAAGEGLRRHGVLTVRNPESPFWIGNLRNSEFRCLVPATAFFAWGKGLDAQGRRVHAWFSVADQPVFAMAGVWMDSEVPSFALLTCEPNAMLRTRGCEAMPVILPADAQGDWLHADWKQAQTLIQPYASALLRAGG